MIEDDNDLVLATETAALATLGLPRLSMTMDIVIHTRGKQSL